MATDATLGNRPWDRYEKRAKIGPRIFTDLDSRMSAEPFNLDHSEGRLMYGDPANYSLGRIMWSNSF